MWFQWIGDVLLFVVTLPFFAFQIRKMFLALLSLFDDLSRRVRNR